MSKKKLKNSICLIKHKNEQTDINEIANLSFIQFYNEGDFFLFYLNRSSGKKKSCITEVKENCNKESSYTCWRISRGSD
jgi:hypothetical protein